MKEFLTQFPNNLSLLISHIFIKASVSVLVNNIFFFTLYTHLYRDLAQNFEEIKTAETYVFHFIVGEVEVVDDYYLYNLFFV